MSNDGVSSIRFSGDEVGIILLLADDDLFDGDGARADDCICFEDDDDDLIALRDCSNSPPLLLRRSPLPLLLPLLPSASADTLEVLRWSGLDFDSLLLLLSFLLSDVEDGIFLDLG